MFAKACAVMSPLSEQLTEEEQGQRPNSFSQLWISVCLQYIFGLFILVEFFGFGIVFFSFFFFSDRDLIAGEMQIAILEVSRVGKNHWKMYCKCLQLEDRFH